MSTEQEKDLGTKGKEDVVKGKMKQAAGSVQAKFGEVTGDKKTELKGHAKQAEGAAQSAAGSAEQKAAEALDRTKKDE